MATPSGFRFYPGWITSAQLNNDATTLVTAWPTQTDQDAGRPWLRPDNEADRVYSAAEVVQSTNGRKWDQGGVNFIWKLRVLSPDMAAYIKDTKFSGARGIQATVQTQNRHGGNYEAYNVYANRVGELEADLATGGYDLYVIECVNGTSATLGDPALSLAQGFSALTVGLEGTVTITVSNDTAATTRLSAATYADLVLAYSIPTEFDFVSVAGTGWTWEYSTNGGSSYAGSSPGTPADTTDIRGTFTGAVAGGASANAVTVTVNPNTNGSVDSSVTVSMAGVDDVTDDDSTTVQPRGFDSGFDDGFGVT